LTRFSRLKFGPQLDLETFADGNVLKDGEVYIAEARSVNLLRDRLPNAPVGGPNASGFTH